MALSDDQVAELERVREMLEVRMREKPRRYQHSLGVARTAVELARAYGVDEYLAALAGLTHDWDKVLDDHELLVRAAQYGVMVSGELARAYGVDEYLAALAGLTHDWDKVLDDHELLVRAAQYGVMVSGSPTLAVGLLHGPVAAHELPHIFEGIAPEVCQAVARHTVGACDMTPLDMVVFTADAIEPGRRGDYAERLREGIAPEVCQAVARHTVGACDMTPLDMVVFTADAIEPGRRGDYAERLRAMVGEEPLEELFFQTFSQGLMYVISGGRYLYPTAIDIYNAYAARRSR